VDGWDPSEMRGCTWSQSRASAGGAKLNGNRNQPKESSRVTANLTASHDPSELLSRPHERLRTSSSCGATSRIAIPKVPQQRRRNE
jgi:hypothetical protein